MIQLPISQHLAVHGIMAGAQTNRQHEALLRWHNHRKGGPRVYRDQPVQSHRQFPLDADYDAFLSYPRQPWDSSETAGTSDASGEASESDSSPGS